jgi:hypothetical protein
MKTKFIALFTALLIVGIHPIIAQTSQKREVSAFTEISLKIGANIHLKQGSTQSVEVKANENTLSKLITEVKDRKLVVRYPSDSWFSKWNPGPVEINITIPQIDGLVISGSGSIVSDAKIESRILNLTISGSGDIKLGNLSAEKVTAVISGSGNITISGTQNAADLKATISGSGNIKALDFPANNVDVKIAGSGNCKVNSVKNLVARLAGSGNIIYRGNPLIDSSIAGSGKLIEEK